MREAIQKVLLAFFAASLVVPAVLLPLPTKSDALVGCLLGAGVNKLIGVGQDIGKDIANAFTSISVHDETVTSAARQTRDQTATLQIKECTLDGMVTLLGQTMIQTFTRNIVDWINRGFEGQPAFITNPEGFAGEVADKVVGAQIKAVAPWLCQPFRLQLQLALGLQYSNNRQQEIGCTLSNVIANVQGSYQGFVGGDFRQGGWQNWLAIAGNNQNNAYGAYFATTDKLNASIVTATGEQIKLLDWGKGFKSWRKCQEYSYVYDYEKAKTVQGDCIKEGPIQTPGSVIVDQTNGALKAQLDRFQAADEIDEILGALTNQLLTRAMGGIGGLLGSSQAGAGGVRYVDTLVTDLQKASQAADAPVAPPAGIDCNLEPFYVQGTGDTVMIRYDYTAHKAMNTATEALDYTKASHPVITKQPPTLSWADYFTQISRGCANVVDQFIATRREQLVPKSGDGGGDTAPPPQTKDGNIATGKATEQSSTYFTNRQYSQSSRAIDGSESSFYSASATLREAYPWWQIDLSKPDPDTVQQSKDTYTVDELRTIEISRRIDEPNQTSDLWVFISNQPFQSDKPPSSVYFSELKTGKNGGGTNTAYSVPNGGEKITVSIIKSEKGPYIRIQMEATRNLTLPEVRINGKTTQNTSGVTTPTNTALSVTVAPAPKTTPTNTCTANRLFTTAQCQSPGRDETVNNVVTLTANRATNADEKIAISVQLAQRNSSVGYSFANLFTKPDRNSPTAFFAEITQSNGAVITRTPSLVRVTDWGTADEVRVMESSGLSHYDTVFPWVPNPTGTSYERVFALNSGITPYSNGPVFIAAGLSLEKDKPLFISFTGTIAGLPPSDYDLLINVFGDKNGILTPIATTANLQINMQR